MLSEKEENPGQSLKESGLNSDRPGVQSSQDSPR
jgi:hypothetical protein